jgi:hypothetical protein
MLLGRTGSNRRAADRRFAAALKCETDKRLEKGPIGETGKDVTVVRSNYTPWC